MRLSGSYLIGLTGMIIKGLKFGGCKVMGGGLGKWNCNVRGVDNMLRGQTRS